MTKLKPALPSFAVAVAMSLAMANAQDSTIENESLRVQFAKDSGTLTLSRLESGKPFLKDIKLSGPGGTATVSATTDKTFGQGKAIEISHPNGGRDVVMLFPKLPFALLRSSLHNAGTDVATTKKIITCSGTVELGKTASAMKTLGTGGLLAPDKNPGSYVWLAAVEPQSRNGIVFGWLTHERGSGVVFSKVQDGKIRVDAQIDYGKLQLDPGRTEELETLAIGYFDDARLGLETWADAVAKVHDVRLKPQPTGYCTWYSQPHGGAADEKRIVELAAFAATNLAPYGFSVVQIDDKWQAGWKRSSPSSPKKNFTTHDPKGPYPSGMKAAADQIKSLGLVPGIWFMPFAGTAGDPFFDAHLEWFAKTPDGKPYDTPWGGTCLDLTHPGARAHVSDVTRRICRDWGFDYIKIDGLWTGTATKQLYVNSGYKEDDLGEAVFHDPKKTNIEVYRDGLKLVREAAGKDVFILGCNAPQNMRSYGGSFGLVDAMRIGPDNKAEWKSLLRGPVFGSRHYFLHGRVWHNDPDPVYVRTNMPINHARLICSWVALSGQLNLSSEWLPGQPPERLDILKRTMPSHNATARPVDLFENDPPRVWTATDGARTVIGLYNWDSSEQKFDYSLEQLGLDPNAEYVAYEFWQDRFIPSVKGRLQMTVPAESCAILSVRPRADHPQVISTSRHVTQGLVELMDEFWNAEAQTLSGRLKVVGGDACELRILSGAGSKVAGVKVSAADKAAGTQALIATDGSPARIKIESATSREVTWSVRFN